ncbi:MAG: TauD/TfdA family dioxygenase, partial [Pseudomonadota bacterium]
DGMKAMLRPLRAVHDFASRSARGWSHERVADGDLDGANRAEHPLIRVHPQTGAASLFINPGSITHIVGFSDEESRALLDYLRDHALKPDYQYRHRWAAGDTIIWDNRCTLHYAVTDYTADRYMHRTTVIGEVPLSLQ